MFIFYSTDALLFIRERERRERRERKHRRREAVNRDG